MSLPDWLPHQCLHCGMHREQDFEEFVDCGSDHPEACDCGANSHNGGWKCPVCGQSWKGLPPEDWDGTILYEKEEPFREPPKNHYGREHLGYRRSKWGDLPA